MPDGSATGPTPESTAPLPIDPDLVPMSAFRGNIAAVRRRIDVVAVIALGGMFGASARYGLSVVMPTKPGQFPWGTFLTNVSGAAVLGLLLVLLTERFAPGRYVRPFLGTGVIGSYTTFSTYMVETAELVKDGHSGLAVAYVLVSLQAGLGAVWMGIVAGRSLVGMGKD